MFEKDKFKVENIIKIQTEQLQHWKTILQPDVFEILKAHATKDNDSVEYWDNIVRGNSLGNFIANFKDSQLNFLNGDLNFDLDKIKSYDSDITVSKTCDFNLDYPFAIDVEDGSYFYAKESHRDYDFLLLKYKLKF